MLPVLPSEQRRIYNSKRKTLSFILSYNEKNRFMYSSAVRFYYLMRNLGIPATLLSGARTAVVFSSILFMTFTGGTFLILKSYIDNKGVISLQNSDLTGEIISSGDLSINRGGLMIKSISSPETIKCGDEIITGDSSALLQFNGNLVKI